MTTGRINQVTILRGKSLSLSLSHFAQFDKKKEKLSPQQKAAPAQRPARRLLVPAWGSCFPHTDIKMGGGKDGFSKAQAFHSCVGL